MNIEEERKAPAVPLEEHCLRLLKERPYGLEERSRPVDAGLAP